MMATPQRPQHARNAAPAKTLDSYANATTGLKWQMGTGAGGDREDDPHLTPIVG